MTGDGLRTSIDENAIGPQPIDPSERIDAIDVLRGIALFGVFAINIVTEFRVSIFQQFLANSDVTSPLDHAVETFLTLAVNMKAFSLFSLLFGVGLAIQFERLAASARRTILLVRRLIVLLAIGLLHLYLIWNGDILTEYAVAGLLVLPFLYGPRWLLALAAIFFLALFLFLPQLLPSGVFPSFGSMTQDVAEANRIYPTGTFAEILVFRIQEIPLIFPLHIYVFPRTLGLFLLGAYAWRTGVLRNGPANNRLLFSIAAIGICLGAALTVMSINRYDLLDDPKLGTILLALGYGAGIIGITNLNGGKALLGWAAPLGRMAFTNYLAQSVIFGWIFYGYGLGLFGSLGVTAALAIGIAVYVGLAIFSAWWLRRYRFGPVEWLWRTLMYGVRQPMSLSQRPLPT